MLNRPHWMLCKQVNCSGATVDTDIGPINIVPLNPASEFTFDVLEVRVVVGEGESCTVMCLTHSALSRIVTVVQPDSALDNGCSVPLMCGDALRVRWTWFYSFPLCCVYFWQSPTPVYADVCDDLFEVKKSVSSVLYLQGTFRSDLKNVVTDYPSPVVRIWIYLNVSHEIHGRHKELLTGPRRVRHVSHPCVLFDFSQTLLEEFKALFPDSYIHLGGDEFQLACWNHSSSVRAFAEHKGMTLSELHGWFEARVMSMVEPSHRRPIVWEETFETLPQSILNSTVVEVWNDLSVLHKVISLPQAMLV